MVREKSKSLLSEITNTGDQARKDGDLRQQLLDARNTIDLLQQHIAKLRESKISLNLSKRARAAKGTRTFARVIVPDSHGCFIDEEAANAFLADLERIKPASIIMLGDHLDCGGFLAEHHTLGYVAEADYSYVDDCNATNQFLDAIQKAAPGALIEYLEGNHERRIEKWIVTQAKRHKKDMEMLHAMFGIDVVLHLEKRGIPLYRQGRFYDGLTVPATIRRDGCYFTHGEYTCKNAASAHLNKYNSNVWYGHTHRADFATKRTVKDGTIAAWNPGCLARLQPLWMHTNLTDWSSGYGLQIVRDGWGHLNLPVPIIAGKSYLQPLMDGVS